MAPKEKSQDGLLPTQSRSRAATLVRDFFRNPQTLPRSALLSVFVSWVLDYVGWSNGRWVCNGLLVLMSLMSWYFDRH
ncbi:hypothetical protein BDW66DRAFT_146346 [Aspergillus desertorum]